MKQFLSIIIILTGLSIHSQVSQFLLDSLNKELYPDNTAEENNFLYGTTEFNDSIIEIRARKNQPNYNAVINICKRIRSTAVLSDTSSLLEILKKYSILFKKEWSEDIRTGNDYGSAYHEILNELIKNYYRLKIKEYFVSSADQYQFLKLRYHKLVCEAQNKYNSTKNNLLYSNCSDIGLYISPFISYYERNASGSSLIETDLIKESMDSFEIFFIEDLKNLNLINDFCLFECKSGIMDHSFLYPIISFYYTDRMSPLFRDYLFKYYEQIKDKTCVPCMLGNTGEVSALNLFKDKFLSDSNTSNKLGEFSISQRGLQLMIPFAISQLQNKKISHEMRMGFVQYLSLRTDERIPKALEDAFTNTSNMEEKEEFFESYRKMFLSLKEGDVKKLEAMGDSIGRDLAGHKIHQD